MTPSIKDTARRIGADIAYRIRAELVCCTIYDDLESARRTMTDVEFVNALGVELAARGHDYCYWAEAAARLAEKHHEDVPERSKRGNFTSEEVIEMRRLYKAGGETFASLAARFGASTGTIPAILYGDSYATVGSPAEFVTRTPRGTATACARGHEFTEKNTKWRTRPNGGKSRECRACRRVRGE